jgi:hypothetical protein
MRTLSLLVAAALLSGSAAAAAAADPPVDELEIPTFELALSTGVAFHQRSSGVWDGDEYVGARATLHIPVVKRRLYAFAQVSIESAQGELVFGDPGTWKTARIIGGLAVDLVRLRPGHLGLVVAAGSQVAVSHTPEPLDGIPDLFGVGARYRARRGGHVYVGAIWDRVLGKGPDPRFSLRVPSPLRGVELDIDIIPTAELPRYQVLVVVPFR